ncbi:MAG: hypothetical protein AAF367_03985 [Pseudomonadota bacterium]
MGYLPSTDTDLTKLNRRELESLQRLLEGEQVKSKARQAHIETLLTRVTAQIGEC